MKLLIVDDQMSVVEGLKRGVNWKAMIRQVGTIFVRRIMWRGLPRKKTLATGAMKG